MPVPNPRWVTLAEGFPPGVVTNVPPTGLRPQDCEDATGLDATDEGWLKAGDIPSGTTRVVKAYTVSGAVAGSAAYEWHYGRLWRTASSVLYWGSQNYNDFYVPQGRGQYDFFDDANAFLKIMPVGTKGLVLFKSTGGYIIPNAAMLAEGSTSGQFQPSDFMQEVQISTATHAVELDGVVYFANSDGLFSVDEGGTVEELSVPIRGDANWAAAALTADYQNKYIIVASTWAYDVPMKRWLRYVSGATTTFDYKSRALASDDGNPITVSAVAFDFERSGSATATLEFKAQVESRGWSDTYSLIMPDERGLGERAQLDVVADRGNSWQLNLTSLPSTVKIRRIQVRVQDYVQEGVDH